MSDTPRTDAAAWREHQQSVVDADFARQLERDLAQRTAEVAKAEAELAALKANNPLAEMWRELAEYQPQAYANGYGMVWTRMCEYRTRSTAADAANPSVTPSAAGRAAARAAAGAAAHFEEAVKSAADAVAIIRRAKEVKP